MNSEIIAYRDKKIAIMQEDPLELNHYVTSDKARAEDYAGREILELLQNAIDVGERVRIQLTGDILIISNSGQPFETENIKALMVPDNSTKANSEETIGCKGVGFRAALNISDDISIYSGDIHIRFSESVARRIEKEYGLEQTPPMMRCPEETTDVFRNDYVTNIVIKIRDQRQIERIKNQIEEINKESILFLNDTFQSLEVAINGKKETFSRKREVINNNEALVTIFHNEEQTELREFFEEGTLNEYQDDRDKKYKISVIYSPESIEHNKLYSFFRTDIDFPMNHWYAHGTFNLTNNRNYLVKNTRNRIIVERLIQLMCDSASKISDQIDYTGYKILRSHGYFSDSILEDTDLNEILERSIDNALVLPTVNNKYTSLNQNPVFYDLNFQKYLLDMPGNDSLLKFTKDEEIVSYLRKDVDCHYRLEVISRYLESKKSDMSCEDCMVCAKLLQGYYDKEDDFADIAPNFFTDKDGNEIKNGSILIESSDSEKLTLPAFMELKYVNEEQLKCAKGLFVCSENYSFVTNDFSKAYGIKVADINEILSKMDKLIEENEDLIPDYVRWLFDNRKAIPNSIFNKFWVLTKDNEKRRSNSLYFGKEYLNGTALEKFYNSSKIIAKPSTFRIEQEEIEDFATFLKEKLYVSDCPRKEEGSFDGLDNILSNGSTKYIINLILENREFLNAYKNKSSAQRKFQSGKWITKKGNRYAPEDVILTPKKNYHKINNYIEGDFLFISQDELLKGIQMQESDKIWLIKEYLCFNKEFYDLSNKNIYKILNELPAYDPRGEISEDIYKDVIVNNNERPKPRIDLQEYYDFINHGKVFCLDRTYHNVKDCLYLEEKYPKVIESEYNFINIVKGKSATAIKDRLNIETLSIDYELESFTKSKANTIDYKNDLNNFKIFLLVNNSERFGDEEKINELNNINIILCDLITISYDDKKGNLDDFEFVCNENIYYVKIPNKSFAELKNNDKFQDALSNVFISKYSFLDLDATARTIGRDINTRIENAKNKYGNNAWTEAETQLDLASSRKDDFSSENFEKLLNLRDKYFDAYESKLYSKLFNATREEKMSYVDKLFEYRDYEFNIEDIPTEKDANILNLLQGIFPILCEEIIVSKDFNRYRQEAYESLCEEFSDEIDILEQLLSDNRYESLLRFGEIAPIRSEMHRLIEKIKSAEEEADYPEINNTDEENDNDIDDDTSQKTQEDANESVDENTLTDDESPSNITTGQTSNSIHFDHRKIIKKRGQVTFVNYEDIKPKDKKSHSSNARHASRRMTLTARKEQEERAKNAEEIALEELEKHGYSNIKWVSDYARQAGVNPNGADGYGYDIKCEKNGEIRYVEVKSSKSPTGIEFEMSENELVFCSQHADNYDIVYVFADNKQATIINNVFYEINDTNKTPASYRITLK